MHHQGLKKSTKRLIKTTFVFLFLGIGQARTQDISVTASVDRTNVYLGETLGLTVEISGVGMGSSGEPILPSIDGFDVISTSSSTRMSFINGALSSSKSYTYVIRATALGKQIIKPIQVKAGGKTYSTREIVVSVTTQTSAPQRSRPDKRMGKGQMNTGGKSGDVEGRIFIRNWVDKKRVFVNEQIILTFGFYNRARLYENPNYVPAAATGFWVEEFEGGNKAAQKILDGKIYSVQELRRAIFPTSAGKLTIGPAELTYSTSDPFSFFSRGENRTLKTDPIEVEVLPLPENGKPKFFSGAVGKFSITATLDKKEVQENQPVTLTLKISGSGNIKSLNEPELPSLSEFKIFDSKTQTKINRTGNELNGSKLFTYVLVPKTRGDYNFGSLQYSYFDPELKKYEVIKTSNIRVKVGPGETVEIASAYGLSREDIKRVGEDIRYIKPDAGRITNEDISFYKSKTFLFIHLLPILVMITALGSKRRSERLEQNKALVRQRKAAREFKKLLSKARHMVGGDSGAEFYYLMDKALTEYIGNKLNLAVAGMTEDQIVEQLRSKGVLADLIDEFRKTKEVCSYARFTPSGVSSENRKQLIEQAASIIERFEKNSL